MKILNLVDLEKSEIKYKISKFPDGQQNITIDEGFLYETIRVNNGTLRSLNYGNLYQVHIKSRLNNFQDVELLICSTKALRNIGIKEITLYIPYFLGSRSDRQFEQGSCNYLKDVICPVINSLNFESVTVLDPHSHVLEACLNNFSKESNIKLFSWATHDLGYHEKGYYKGLDNCILVSPDAGASHKIYKLAEQIGYKGDIITCSKERDEDGKLTKCVVPNIESIDLNKDIIIVDDIFDYGKTFINISAVFNDVDHKGKKYLIVTHSIQTVGLHNALKWFDAIYTTNSVKEHNIPKVYQLNIF